MFMVKKDITIQDLAIMVQKGFLGVSSEIRGVKEELHEFKTEMKEFQKNTVEEFGRINDDIHDIKVTLGPLVRITADNEIEVKDLKFRVGRLERKVGLTK